MTLDAALCLYIQKQTREEVLGRGVLFHAFLGYWRTDCAVNVMATNSEQLSRGFVTETNQEVNNTGEY